MSSLVFRLVLLSVAVISTVRDSHALIQDRFRKPTVSPHYLQGTTLNPELQRRIDESAAEAKAAREHLEHVDGQQRKEERFLAEQVFSSLYNA